MLGEYSTLKMERFCKGISLSCKIGIMLLDKIFLLFLIMGHPVFTCVYETLAPSLIYCGQIIWKTPNDVQYSLANFTTIYFPNFRDIKRIYSLLIEQRIREKIYMQYQSSEYDKHIYLSGCTPDKGSLVVINNSSLLTSPFLIHSSITLPTMFSFLYRKAVSKCRYPLSKAVFIAFLTSKGSVAWNQTKMSGKSTKNFTVARTFQVPSPIIGILALSLRIIDFFDISRTIFWRWWKFWVNWEIEQAFKMNVTLSVI